MTELSKKAASMARDAGRAAHSEPPDRRGVDSCPFEPGDPQRKEWLEGFQEVIEGERPTADLRSEVREALKEEAS